MVLVLEQFIDSLRESRLIPAEDVASLQESLRGSKTPHSVEDVTKLLVQSGKLTEYQATVISQGRPQNLILGEYVLLNILGKGGMGVVFLARHRLMDRIVALKTLPAGVIKPETVQRFYREVKAVARLSHPNIVTAYDAGEHAGTHYLVMEYVAGRDLSAIIKEKGPLPLRQAIDYAQQAARGLDYAHKHGVVHRDVKPSNLLLDKAGVVKILDMGLARLNENLSGTPEAMELTGTGQILGTVDYMSPEQAEDVRSADHRSDIYSLGCTLFYLLTRRAAYGGETILKRILAHRDEPIPSVMELRPDCPETLDAAIRRMLAKRPEDRPQSMAEIIDALEGCLAKPDAAPPLASELPERPQSVRNWLEDLGPEGATARTEDSQAEEVTLRNPPAEDFASPPLPGGAAASAIRRPHSQTHRPRAKKSGSAARGRNRWNVAAVVMLATVILAAATTAVVLNRRGNDIAAADEQAKAGEAAAHDDKIGEADTPAKPDQSHKGPAWEQAWADTKARADGLVAQRQFVKAIHEYSALAETFQDPLLKQRCNEAIRSTESAADRAYQKVAADAREHLRKGLFGKAREALQPVLANYGPGPAGRAGALMQEIGQAESRAASQAAKPPETPPAPKTPAISAELLKQRQLAAAFAAAMADVEACVARWDFQGADREAAKVRFDAPELTARLAVRRDQIRRLDALKLRMIAAINKADPRLSKIDLSLRGINGEIEKADGEAITAALPNGKQESLAWPELGPKATNKLLQLAVRRDDAGDWLAAGLLSLTGQDVESAERYFDKARSMGADTAACTALLAAKDFATVRDLLNKHKYAEGESLLTGLEAKYGKLPWFTANKPELDAAANEAKRGLREKAAEGIYAQAAALFRNGDFYELKPVVERLKTQYADSAVAADPERKPSLAELEKAVADLGPLVRVRKDGKGDAKTIQEAVNGAPPKAVIQLEEVGPWSEQVLVPAAKAGLTIRGKRGPLPVITTAGAKNTYSEPLVVEVPQLSLERLAIVRADAGGPRLAAITAEKTALSLREVVVYGYVRVGKDAVARDCVFVGHVGFRAFSSLENVLVYGGVNCGADSQLRHCTITGPLHLAGRSGLVEDCIVSTIDAPQGGQKIEHCDVFGENPYKNQAAPGKGCLKAPPRFFDEKNFDLRLQALSPCRKAASDGGDMGITYSAEMQTLLKAAADLHK